MPTRGNVPKIGTRAAASPVSRPCQNGELAASARSIGTCTRMPRSARTADSGSGSATWTWSANVGSRRASSRMES
jgi:hypothetical protein